MAFEDLFGDASNPSNGVAAKSATTAAAGTKAPITDAQHRAAVEAHKAKLAAQGVPAAVQYGYCASCGTALDKVNASRAPNGSLKHIGCPSANDKLVEGPAGAHIGTVNPADGPEPDILRDAAPLSAETIAAVEDPELKARATKHAADVAAKRAAEEAAKPAADKKAGGRCVESGKKVVLSREEGARRKRICACGRVFEKIKDAKLIFENDQVLFEIPGHNLDKPKVEAAPAPSSAPEIPPELPDEAPPELPMESAPEIPPELPMGIPPSVLDTTDDDYDDYEKRRRETALSLESDGDIIVTVRVAREDMLAFARMVAAAMKGEI